MAMRLFGRRLAIVALAAALCGCESYLVRRDAITAGVGDTVRSNIVAQVDDMQPRGAANPNLAFSAERLARRNQAAATPDNPLLSGSTPGLNEGIEKLAGSALSRGFGGRR